MTSNSQENLSKAASRGDRAAVISGRSLPVILSVLFITTAFAKVLASVAHSLSILLFLLNRFFTRTPLRGGRMRAYYMLLAVYAGVMLLSLVNTEDLRHGIQLYRTILWKVLIVVVLVETVRSCDEVKRLLTYYMIGCSVLAVIAVYEGLVQHVYRPPEMWIAVHGGNLLMFGLIAMIALAIHAANGKQRIFLYCMMALSGYALYLNGTRGVWIAMVCVVALVPLLAPRFSWKGKVIAYTVLLLGAVLVAQAPFVQEKYREAVSNLVQYQHDQPSTSVGYRIDMWKASIVMFREHPVLGVGLGDWQQEVGKLIDRGSASPTIRHYGQTHNMFLDALSTQGIAGLLSLLAIMAYPGWIILKEDHAGGSLAKTLFVCGTVACFLSGLTDTLVHIRGVFLSYMMFIGISLVACQCERSTIPSSPVDEPVPVRCSTCSG